MKESKCLSCGQGLGEVERLEKCVEELEAHRVPNPGVVGTLQNKNLLLEYKDAQIARLQEHIEELERGRCADCGAALALDGCVLCGAPVCCPQCCRIQSLADHIEKLQAAVKELEAIIGRIRQKPWR